MSIRLSSIPKLGLLGALALSGAIALAKNDSLYQELSDLFRADGINTVDGARRSLVYRLSDRPTQFRLSGGKNLVRILSSASIAQDAPPSDSGWTYGYRLTYLDAAGARIGERDVYTLGLLPEMTQEIEPRRFLRTSTEQIAVQDETVIAVPEGTAAIDVTSLDADAGVIGLDIRLYERQPLTDAGALVVFRRRSEAEQRQLASGSAFPPDTLTTDEMMTLARNNWRPVGPSGIAGEAYELVVMYIVDVDEDEGGVEVAP